MNLKPKRKGRAPLAKVAYLRMLPKEGLDELVAETESAYPEMRGAALRTRALETGCRALLSAAKKAHEPIDDLEVKDANN